MVLVVLRALGRRWYFVLVGLLLTAGLTYGAFKVAPPEHNARMLVLLLPSEEAVGVGGNPFLSLSGLEQPAGILVAYFSSSTARTEVEELSTTAEYQIGIEDSTRGPVIAVDVTDRTAADTLEVLDHFAERIPEQLSALQSEVGAPEKSTIGSMILTADKQAKEVLADTLRMVIAAVLVGLVGTIVGSFAIDGLLQRRSRRRMLRGPVARSTAEDADPSHSAVNDTTTPTEENDHLPTGDDSTPDEATDGAPELTEREKKRRSRARAGL